MFVLLNSLRFISKRLNLSCSLSTNTRNTSILTENGLFLRQAHDPSVDVLCLASENLFDSHSG